MKNVIALGFLLVSMGANATLTINNPPTLNTPAENTQSEVSTTPVGTSTTNSGFIDLKLGKVTAKPVTRPVSAKPVIDDKALQLKQQLCKNVADTAVFINRARQANFPKARLLADIDKSRAELDTLNINNDFVYQSGLQFIDDSRYMVEQAYQKEIIPKNKLSFFLATIDSKTYRNCMKTTNYQPPNGYELPKHLKPNSANGENLGDIKDLQ